jgi:ABC-type transport system involved in multi-copper enzyme maturation permease subunit
MNRLLTIARGTLLEAIRHRILYLLVFFAVAMILFSRFVSMLTVGQDAKIIKDLGLSAINLFGLLVALFVGVGILFREMERRTVQTTLAAPVARWEYLLGKYAGISAAILLNATLMALTLFGLLAINGDMDLGLVKAAAMLLVELLFITAAAVFFSSLK